MDSLYNCHLYNSYNLLDVLTTFMCQWPRVNQIKEKFKTFNFFPLHDNSPVNAKCHPVCAAQLYSSTFMCTVLHTCLVEYTVQYIQCTWCM